VGSFFRRIIVFFISGQNHVVIIIGTAEPNDADIATCKEVKSIRYLLNYWIPVFFWMCFIFWMSTSTFSSQNTALIIEPILRFLMPSISQEMINEIHWTFRKLAHVGEYFIFGILLFRAFRGDSKKLGILKCAIFSFIILSVYAASDEFHQSCVATRTASLNDVGIDMFGGIISLGISALLPLSRWSVR